MTYKCLKVVGLGSKSGPGAAVGDANLRKNGHIIGVEMGGRRTAVEGISFV
jgi:hypothetical protein